ncbi:MAG: conserved rane protein of unknown function [Candidatus Saccharibacteria bacterium]|nr:conserved rane protein of unknown function [Candidatus Saccharibacteria bacterium]
MVKKKQAPKETTPIDKIVASLKDTQKTYLARRPHRSFRRTRRRDYVRTLQLPGYFSFTNYVRKTLWANRKTFLLLSLVYAVITAVMVGVASQSTYTTLNDTISQTSGDLFAGNLGAIGKAGLLFFSAISGGLSSNLTPAEGVYAGLIIFITWLTTIWLLRNILAGHKVKLRDGLYNATAPLLSTVLVGVVLILQLIPAAIAAMGYTAAQTTGLLNGGVEAMLFWLAAGSLALLSLYLITSTFIALVVVTLPGMYPIQALRTAGDLVIGRRIRILLRILWLGLSIALSWVILMIPIILFDSWLKSLWPAVNWLPIVPVALLILGALTVIWATSYIYLLYRRIVADDSAPA